MKKVLLYFIKKTSIIISPTSTAYTDRSSCRSNSVTRLNSPTGKQILRVQRTTYLCQVNFFEQLLQSLSKIFCQLHTKLAGCMGYTRCPESLYSSQSLEFDTYVLKLSIRSFQMRYTGQRLNYRIVTSPSYLKCVYII